jgi:deazaflavin-dependent oxidoreductase (nitroreductase family)
VSDWNQKIIDEFRASGGRVGGGFEGASMILIHHVGAKSAARRVTPLVYFPEDGGSMVIVASAAGAPKHPAWYHNLTAHPKIDVEVGTETFPVIAEEIAGEERDAIWQRVINERPGFADYQRRTSRTIPLLRLTPVR